MGIHAVVLRLPGKGHSASSPTLGKLHPIVINETLSGARGSISQPLEEAFGPGPYIVAGLPVEQLAPYQRPFANGALLTTVRHGIAASAVPALVLVTHSGPDAGRIIELRQGRYRLGRPGLDRVPGSTPIELRDPALSRLHAELLVSAKGVRITDAASQNGLWVDGRRVSRAELSTASLVRTGNTTFRICVPDSVPAPAGNHQLPEPLIVPAQPPGPSRPGMLLAAALPLGLGIVLALTTGMWIFLAFSALTALTAFGGFAAFQSRRRKFHTAVATTAAADRARRRLAHPSPGEQALTVLQANLHRRAANPGSSAEAPNRLAEPQPTFAENTPGTREAAGLRLGTGTMPANIELQVPRENWAPPFLDDVPVVLPLPPGIWIRVAGPGMETMGMLRSALLQLSSAQQGRPRPVLILCREVNRFVCDARLLPGVQLLSAGDIAAATAAIQAAAGRDGSVALTVLAPPVVSEEAGILWARLPAETRNSVVFLVGTDSDGVGTDPDPATGSAAISLAEDGGILAKDGTALPFHPDLIGPLAFHRTASLLASLSVRTGQPPAPPELFPRSDCDIASAWAGHTAPRALIGHRGPAPVALDLRADGPHFLIAGTTGSGKSELLRTFVASLAATVPPTRLNFLLIDFKGGSGLAPLARLPHTAGFLTDLSGENVARTLTSLRAELKRREELLAAADADDLDGFNGVSPLSAAIPRLIVVIDEFRMLADAVPHAVDELMRIAVLGRSLGLHLVMATQRPQGAVTADIRANVATSVCLRVQSAMESRDVVGCDDAADIPASFPGRGFLRVAGARAFPFQVSSTTSGTAHQPPLVQTLAEYLATPLSLRDPIPGTSLEELVEAIMCAAVAGGYPPEAQRPVQPPLPDSLPHSSHGHLGNAGSALFLGLADRPEQQRQCPLGWSPDRDSHLALIGTGSAGTKATAALVASEHLTSLPGRHLYVLDGDGSLAWTAAHAQTAAYVAPHEIRRAARVITVLGNIILQRLAGGYRGSCAGVAGITLLVSGWGRWQEAFRSSRFPGTEDDLLGLARDGETVDLCLVISGNRELLAARFFQLIPNRLWFPAGLTDDALLAWPRMPPMKPVTGRAYVQGRIGAPSGAVAQCGEPPASRSRTPLPEGVERPRRVDALPPYAGPEDLSPASGPDCFPLGVHGDALETAEAHLPSGAAFLVLGPPGSGRTTLLRQFALTAGPDLAVYHFTPSGLGPAMNPAAGESPPEGSDQTACLILIDNADRLPAEDHPRISRLLDGGARLVLAAAPGFGLVSRLPLGARLRSDPRGALLAPGHQADAEFFGIRLDLDGPPRPGRGCLIAGGRVTETQFARPA